MRTSVVSRPNDLFAITRGPLVYSLPIEENWVQVNKDSEGREFPHCDYEVLPTSPWNYGLCIDEENVADELILEELELGNCPFSPQGAPIAIKTKGKKDF